jgi:transcriptional regulator with PAS, ATPase and Fis domain
MELPRGLIVKPPNISFDMDKITLEQYIKYIILQRYKKFNSSKTAAAHSLGISRSTMYRYLTEYGIL